MTLPRLALVSSGVLLAALCVTPVLATFLPIANSSFETYVLADGVSTTNGLGLVDYGWSVDGGGQIGVWNPPSFRYASIPDGLNVAYSHGPVISQVLTSTLREDRAYHLEVEIGNYGVYPAAGYEIQLLAGATVLPGVLVTPTPTVGQFVTASVHYEAGFGDPYVGQAFEIRLISRGDEVDFDNVRLNELPLSGIPEPTPAILLSVLFGGLAILRATTRRR